MRIQLRAAASEDQGAVAIFVAVLMVVLVVLAAFSVDLGYAYATKRQLQVSSDASALAAAQSVGLKIPLGSSESPPLDLQEDCDSLIADLDAQGLAATAVAASTMANSSRPTTTDVQVSCAVENGQQVIDVSVQSSREIDTFLASVIGVSSLNPGTSAVARVTPQQVGPGLRPYVVCDTEIRAAIDDRMQREKDGDPPVTYQARFDNVTGSANNDALECNGTVFGEGNWGIVDFSNTSAGTSEIRDWTQNGYPGSVAIPFEYETRPGGPFQAFGDLGDLALPAPGTTISLPVLETSGGGGGSTGNYLVTGVVSVVVCGTDRNGNGTKGACWDAALAANTDPPADANETLFQYRPVQVTAPGVVFTYSGETPECTSFIEEFCVPGVYLYK